ncbi:uncharacterized protein [Triticum aestivum]|uniref:uncharacterized protein isoform X2 n=1 Tax=Triticum aestivum TaxID=4565 RepID=UPI001D02E791|nr:uncharacterized protein LOC123091285 isoform X2 [Triticum aestivum]
MKIKKNPTQLQASRADRSWPQTRSPTQPCCCRFFLLLSRFPLPHPTPPPPPPTSSLAPRPSAPASTAIAAVPILSPSRSRSRSGQAVCRSATAYSSTQPTATDHPPPFLTWVVIHNPVVAEEESGAQPLAPRNPSLRLRLTDVVRFLTRGDHHVVCGGGLFFHSNDSRWWPRFCFLPGIRRRRPPWKTSTRHMRGHTPKLSSLMRNIIGSYFNLEVMPMLTPHTRECF